MAVANVIDACPDGNDCALLPSGRSRRVAYLSPTVRPPVRILCPQQIHAEMRHFPLVVECDRMA